MDAVPVYGHSTVIHRCEWEDLALITTVPQAAGHNVEFFDLSRDWIDPVEEELLHCFGFPADGSIHWETNLLAGREERIHAVYPNHFDGMVMPRPSHDELKFKFRGFDSDKHLLISFPDAAEGRHPRGYSGSAAWWESNKAELIWRANLKFAGICTSCYKKGSVEQIVKASVVRRFLEETFGPV